MADDCSGPLGIPDPLCIVGSGVQDAVGSVAGSAIEALAEAVEEAVAKAVTSLGTIWVKVGTPNLTTSNGGSTPSEAVGFIQGSLWWYMAAAAVLAVIVGGTRMAWEHKAEPGRELVKALLTLVVVAGAGLTAIALAVTAADAFSEWIINRSTEGTDFGQNMTLLLGVGAVTGIGALLVILMGLLAIFASIIQIGLMVVRGGMLVILAGILPISASATNTEMGRAWFKKCIAWLIAFILYKPAAAIIYATAFQLAGSDVFGGGGEGDDLLKAITGLVLMVLALIALPALMRFVMPMVSSMASGGGGSAMAAGAMMTMPTGAMRMPKSSGAGAGAGGGSSSNGGSGPSGSSGIDGGRGPRGSSGASSPGGGSSNGGTSGGTGPSPAAGAATPAAAGAGPAAAGAGAGGGAAAGAGAVAGPAGMAAGAALAGGAQAAKAAKQAGQGAAESQTGDKGGPRGSN